MGGVAAEIHNTTEDFTTLHERFRLDLGHLLYEPMEALKPLLAQRPSDWPFLDSLGTTIGDMFERMGEGSLDWGFCHGDLADSNVYFHDGDLTVFDFDCGGMGWRAYDLAAFLTSLIDAREAVANPEALWAAFLSGYRNRRDISERDLSMIPTFVALRQIWVLGVHVQTLNEEQRLPHFFDHIINFLKGWKLTEG